MRFTDAYVQWNKSTAFAMTFGKHAAPFTNEGATSSRELLTIDRSIIGQNIWFPQEYMPGVSVSGRMAPWNYRVGVYSSGAMNREFGEFSGDYFTLALVGYDFAKKLSVKEAVLTGNYLYQHPDPDNTFTRQLEHVMSMHFRLEADKWGVRTDLSNAQGYLGQSDMWAAMAMPFYNITPKLQAVARYTYMDSEAPNGIRPTGYEARVVPGRGDEFNELYLGANYYFYGHTPEGAERRAVGGHERQRQRRRRVLGRVVDDGDSGGLVVGPWCLVLGAWSVLRFWVLSN